MSTQPAREPGLGLSGHGWLPAVVPADARRFRVIDPRLASGLELAGGEVVEDDADVEIGPAGALRRDAPVSIATIASSPVFGPLPLRAAGRIANSALVWLRAMRAWRASRSDYPVAEVLRFDLGHAFALPSAQIPLPPRRLAERFPQQAIVVARRGARSATALELALADAAERSGRELRPRWASMRAGVVVVVGEDAVVRVALGRGRNQIGSQLDVLDALRRAGPPPAVEELIAWSLAHGRSGLADWSLERLMPGSRPPKELTPALLGNAVEFLVELWRVSDGPQPEVRFADFAATVATVCSPEQEAAVRALAERLDRELEGLPRGFAHGDFFAGNMLADGDRLTAVLDWDSGGPGRLPFVDLVHLHRTLVHGGDDLWGAVFVEYLLPFARAGGDETVARYARALGLEHARELLEELTLAYWLEHTSYQLRTHDHRRFEPEWIKANVERVLAAVGPT